ncbi:hypothetical protein [Bacillus massilinigeriensis]|uniref:hypothetical protein n=1 Tax=Bacillus mediterraneensis TaxID=1805474 RepID=UPI0013566B60|nr:hypothetical protein [Bacillus mediterraneensis]
MKVVRNDFSSYYFSFPSRFYSSFSNVIMISREYGPLIVKSMFIVPFIGLILTF